MGIGTAIGGDNKERTFEHTKSEKHDYVLEDGSEDADESPSRLRRFMLVLGAGAGALMLAGGIGFVKGEASKDDELAAARAETRAALALGQAGYDNIVSLESEVDGTILAKLSLNPDDPQSCTLAFIVEEDPAQLTLTRQDSAGTLYGEIVTENPALTHALMTEECA